MADSSSPSITDLVRTLSEVRVVRFCVVGASNTALSYGIFRATNLLMPAAGSNCVSYAIAMLWSYYWNRRWTFESQGQVASEASRFFTTQIAFMLLSSAMLGYLVDRRHLPTTLCWLGTVAIITVLNFLVSRYWSFKRA